MTKETFDKIDYWDTNEYAEELYFTDISEVIRETTSTDGSTSVVVYGSIRKKLQENTRDWLQECVLEYVMEMLDEEYGSPVEPSDANVAMVRAAGEFADVIVDDYHVWQCDLAGAIEVDILPGGEIVLPDFETVE